MFPQKSERSDQGQPWAVTVTAVGRIGSRVNDEQVKIRERDTFVKFEVVIERKQLIFLGPNFELFLNYILA